jgi:hypothetical protein
LPEALARVSHDSVVSGAKRHGGGRPERLAHALHAFVAPLRARHYAGLALAATIVGIVVNALVFQHERHPSPFFSGSGPASTVSSRMTSDPLPRASTENPVALPPMRPANLAGASPIGATAKSLDPIANILTGGVNRDQQHLLGAAQAALIKLGYSFKSGGAPGADVLAALREYERSHGLPVSTEITPHVVKQLVAAVNASASR